MIPSFFTPYLAALRVAAVALVLAACFGAGWTANGWRLGLQIAEINRASAQAITKGVQDALATTNALQRRKDAALAEAASRGRALAAGAAAARAESHGLRADLSAARADLANLARRTGTDDPAATGALLDAMEQGIDRLAGEGARIAGAADGHASDALTLRMTWPNLEKQP